MPQPQSLQRPVRVASGMIEPAALPAHLLPSVRVAVRSAMLRAGVESLLAAAGLSVQSSDHTETDVLIVDDTWLADPDALADALAASGAIVALGAGAW
ncbi:MAG: LuxR family transcriptional regulator, partial [Deinococcus sp.]|nr:LuxR family transcriptional regulator [Deinococcus sp.]